MVTSVGPQKLPYTISSVSSEDQDHPATELLVQHPDSPGWQTERYSQFPQEIELQLSAPARLVQLQVLSHEFKTPRTAVIYASSLPPGCSDPSEAVEKRLGYLHFGDAERAGFQTRELKTITLEGTHALFVRLVLQEYQVNQHNIWNQIGLCAINLVGAHRCPQLA